MTVNDSFSFFVLFVGVKNRGDGHRKCSSLICTLVVLKTVIPKASSVYAWLHFWTCYLQNC